MSAPTVACTFCHGALLLTIDDETIICPAHPELHDSDGRPQFTVEQVATGDITIDECTRRPGLAVLMAACAALTLWGLIALAVMNPGTAALVGCSAVLVWFCLVDGDPHR